MSVSVELADGDSVIAWQTTEGVYFQEFDSNDDPLGTTTNVESSSVQWLSIASLADGGFSVIWDTSAGSQPTAQDYDAEGTPAGSPYALTTTPPAAETAFTSRDMPTASSSGTAWTTLLPNGDTVTLSALYNGEVQIDIQQYDAAGNAVGPAYIQTLQGLPGLSDVEIAPLANGDYAVSLVHNSNYSGDSFVYLFAPDGTFITSNQITVAGYELIQSQAIAGLPDGGFAVTWVQQESNTAVGDFSPYAVYSEEFNAAGTAVTPAQMLGPYVANESSSGSAPPQIDAFPNGQYTISWASDGTPQSVTLTEQGSPLTPDTNDAIVTPAIAYNAPIGPHTLTMVGDEAQTVTANNLGDTIISNDDQSTLIGGTGNDTLIAGHNSNVMTGNGGDDSFVFNYLPWNSNGQITDFNAANDVLDLQGIFASIGYTGSNPVADGYLSFVSDGNGDTAVIVNPQGPQTNIPITVTTLDGVSPSSITPADYGYGSSTGTTVETSDSTYTAPEGVTNIIMTGNAPQTVIANNAGDTITSNDYQSTLIGGSGNDTLIAGHNSNVMTGNGGDDSFVFNYLPWNNNGQITDFNTATDVLNLNGIAASIGYTGGNAVADGYLSFVSDGNGDTQVYVDPQGPSTQIPILVTTLEHVNPSAIHASDWMFA